MKLADLESRIQAAHISLIRRAWHAPTSIWACVLASALGNVDLKTSLSSKTKIAEKITTHYPTFRQLLKTWAKFHFTLPESEEVRSEILWNNDSILIKKKTFMWVTTAGIVCVNDLLHQTEPRFLSHEELSTEYGIPCTFLEVFQIRAAIPCHWKRLIVLRIPSSE